MSAEDQKTSSDRIPRGAIATVIVGLIVTLMVIAVDLVGEDSARSDSTEWVTVEPVETAAPQQLGNGGSFGLARTTISAIAPIESGDLLFRVAGVVEIDSGNTAGAAVVRCDVTSPAEGSSIARTPKRRAAWPRPSIDLQAQPVPEELVVKFRRRGNDVLGLPVRDSFRTFTDSAEQTDVDWDGFEEQTQNWVWTMPDGTGEGGASLTYLVVFRTTEKPDARVVCTGSSGDDRKRISLELDQQEWPVVDPTLEDTDAESEETADAEVQAE